MIPFAKGHGTENDFVVLPDPDDRLDLTADLTRAVCDRRAGVGADGVLRAVRRDGGWFMDYRNADGSLAEMCGNGIRVFARYLVEEGLAEPGALTIATRAGARTVWLGAEGDVTVHMGRPRLLDDRPFVHGRPGTAVSMGNPHVVVPLDGEDELAGLDLSKPPLAGYNVEFAVRRGPAELAMRVYERGVGETRSCGTGVCAAVVATGEPGEWTVVVPGGRLAVRWADDGVLLTGPALIVARGELAPALLR